MENKIIEIPFGAKDSELCGWEYTIPEGFVASIENGKIVVKKEESEDGKIREWLIGYFNQYIIDGMPQVFGNGLNVKDIIAWLEKQGEKEEPQVYETENGEIITYSETDGYKVDEPKFKVGDEIRTGNEESQIITKIDEKGYWSEDLFICDFDEECIWDLAERKPADNVERKFHKGDWITIKE